MVLNVLVVDDSAVVRSMLVRTLRLSGLPLTTVYQAGDLAEALGALGDHDVDLALIDLDMPDTSGEQLVDAIRADSRLAGVALIIVAPQGAESRLPALKSRGVTVLLKPFTPEQVRSTVLRVIGVADA
jgi:two-component system chemotaxis response regulator CheY